MFAKLYSASLHGSTAAATSEIVTPRVITLHGLMGSGRNWSGVARRVSSASPGTSKVSYLLHKNANVSASAAYLEQQSAEFRPIPIEMLTLDWRNHGRSVHESEHGLDYMAADLDFILRKCNNIDDTVCHASQPSSSTTGRKSTSTSSSSKIDDYGGVNDIFKENSIPWRSVTSPISAAKKNSTSSDVNANDSMWYVPFTTGQQDYLRRSETVSITVTKEHIHVKSLYPRQPIFLMGHSMGGAALMHFITNFYAPEWEKHLQRRAATIEERDIAKIKSKLFSQQHDGAYDNFTNTLDFLPPSTSARTATSDIDDVALTPEEDPLFPYVPIAGLILVDIGPCARPPYAQKLGGAVVAVKTLPIPQRRRRAVGDLIRATGANCQVFNNVQERNNAPSASEPAAKSCPFAAAAASPHFTVPPPSQHFKSRTEVERHLLANGPKDLFDAKVSSSVWLARYLLTNVKEGDVGDACIPWRDTEPERNVAQNVSDEKFTLTRGQKQVEVPPTTQQQVLITVDLLQRGAPTSEEGKPKERVAGGIQTPNVAPPIHWEPNIDVIVRDLPLNTWRDKQEFTPLKGVKTLFIFGGDSPYWQHTDAKTAIYKYFPEAEVRLVTGGGHFVMIEKQAEFSEIVKQFVANSTQIK